MDTSHTYPKIACYLKRCGITPGFKTVNFADVKKLPRVHGIYSIWQDDRCIYVGQGAGKTGIRGRCDPHHVKKAKGTITGSTKDTNGWSDGRNQSWWDPSQWKVEYLECQSAVHRTYLEGAMILELDPWANDETYSDRNPAQDEA